MQFLFLLLLTAKPVLQPQFPNVFRLVLNNGILKGGLPSLTYSHAAHPSKYVNMHWQVNTSESLYHVTDSGKMASTFSFVEPKLDGGLDEPHSVISATFVVSLNISRYDISGYDRTLTYHRANATVLFHILKICEYNILYSLHIHTYIYGVYMCAYTYKC